MVVVGTIPVNRKNVSLKFKRDTREQNGQNIFGHMAEAGSTFLKSLKIKESVVGYG